MANGVVKINVELMVMSVPAEGFPGRLGSHLDMHLRMPQLLLFRQIHEALLAEGFILDGRMRPASGKADVVRYIVQEVAKAVREATDGAQKDKKKKGTKTNP